MFLGSVCRSREGGLQQPTSVPSWPPDPTLLSWSFLQQAVTLTPVLHTLKLWLPQSPVNDNQI